MHACPRKGGIGVFYSGNWTVTLRWETQDNRRQRKTLTSGQEKKKQKKTLKNL